MKTRTIKLIRVIGIIILLFSMLMIWYSQQDSIGFNGKELLALTLFIIGLYLILGTKKSLESWFFKDNFSESAILDEDEEYDYDDDYDCYDW